LLIVRLSALGDVVHTLPALELLRAALPEAELTWAVEAFAAPLLRGHPALDRIVVLDRRGVTRAGARLRGLRALGAGVRALRRERFDAALDFQGLLRSALVARGSGARRVFGPGWAREGATLLYTDRLAVPRPHHAHAVLRAGAIVRESLAALGVATSEGALPSGRLPGELLGGFAPTPGALVLLPGAGKPANRPPAELLAAIADRCVGEHPTLEVVLVGGPHDRSAAASIQAQCRSAAPRSVCGVSLAESAAWLESAAVVLGGDTGPLHLARALGRPVVGLFHAADSDRTSPAGLPGAAGVETFSGQVPCAPCCARRCQRADGVRICLDTLKADAIAESVLGLIRQGVGTPP
jgi:lipopolysaccharide heptosyltransferase I